MSGDEAIIIDTPGGIQAFFLLQIFHKLKMEVKMPDGPTWRYSPRKQANQLMLQRGYILKEIRTKKDTLVAYEQMLKDLGVLSDGS